MNKIPQLFGSMVFGDHVMQERLPEATYKAVKETVEKGKRLDAGVVHIVAKAMKEWAVEKGATHYTHWFQPMTGITAEKHDSFISPVGADGVIMEFSGKELMRGESDASSFPSGGLRTTFEARGYTAWDPTSYAFVKDNTLFIPTAFYSYGGECLDKKTPLMRSMEALNKQAKRILLLFGDAETARVIPTVGAEQEYFLIDKDLYKKRQDLVFTGRTLFGSRPPKGQEMDDHYFGTIKPRVQAFMQDLDEELWKLGVLAKTEHNEAAPAQHELAPIFTSVNTATDHNQLTMEMMKRVAEKHGLVCLLHEKPFAGVNGSGKHNNWSLSTSSGENLLDPGAAPSENLRFLLFLTAVIEASDTYQDLLRFSVATAGNDHRLGANEAPPAIISVFLGDELTEVLDAIAAGTTYSEKEKHEMKVGVRVLPRFAKDTTDRNRTSPMAFTGNKFEFRMVGSSLSIAEPNIVLNTIVADALSQYAEKLEGSLDFENDVRALIREAYTKHKRIVFSGDNYAVEWADEAARRGLLNLRTTPEALPYFVSERNIKLFARHNIFTEGEMRSRYEILTEEYTKVLHIEALTALDIATRDILPAISRYAKDVADRVKVRQELLGNTEFPEKSQMQKLYQVIDTLYTKTEDLRQLLAQAEKYTDCHIAAGFYKDFIRRAMDEVREAADEGERLTAASYWPMPTYAQLLFS
ncbi:MAG: glutamine synthetase III [Clostridia bacterium]|nr:glutamine synthetase III [Clostridia bacterium]